jgi:hypothetical protein
MALNAYAECQYGECQYAKCHYVECQYAQCQYAQCQYAQCPYAECQYAKCHHDKCRYTEYYAAIYNTHSHFHFSKLNPTVALDSKSQREIGHLKSDM